MLTHNSFIQIRWIDANSDTPGFFPDTNHTVHPLGWIWDFGDDATLHTIGKLFFHFFADCNRNSSWCVDNWCHCSVNLNLVFTWKTSNSLNDDIICIVIFICSVVTLTSSLLSLPIRTNRRLSFLPSSCNERGLSIAWKVITFSVSLYLHGRLIFL